jgi:preprotein translocase subunit YajC
MLATVLFLSLFAAGAAEGDEGAAPPADGGAAAKADPNAAQPQGTAQLLWNLLPFVGIAFVLLFMFRRQSGRQDRERQEMLSRLDKNDKVLTIGGIYGTVISVNPAEDEVVVKVDDNTRLKVTKASISRNITKEQAAAAPKTDATSTAVTSKPSS